MAKFLNELNKNLLIDKEYVHHSLLATTNLLVSSQDLYHTDNIDGPIYGLSAQGCIHLTVVSDVYGGTLKNESFLLEML